MLKLCFIGWGNSPHTRNWLEWFAKRGHRVMLITNYPGEIKGAEQVDISIKSDTRPRIKRYVEGSFNWDWLRFLKTLLQVKRLVNDFEPDVLHLHTLFYPAYLGALIGFRPLVVMPWNGDILWDYKKTGVLRWIVRRTLRRADLILYHSDQMRLACLNYMNNKDRLLNWLGADLNMFHTDTGSDPNLRVQFNLGEGPVIVSPRGLGNFYNVDIIMRSVPVVCKRQPGVRFVFIWPSGTVEQMERLKALAKRLNVEDCVRLVEKLPYADVPAVYRLADVMVSLSSNDAVPNSLVEAMACGAVPVMGDLPQIREWVQDGVNGFVVPCRDEVALSEAIIRLLEDDELRGRFIEYNLALVREKGDYNRNLAMVEKRYYQLSKEREGRR